MLSTEFIFHKTSSWKNTFVMEFYPRIMKKKYQKYPFLILCESSQITEFQVSNFNGTSGEKLELNFSFHLLRVISPLRCENYYILAITIWIF